MHAQEIVDRTRRARRCEGCRARFAARKSERSEICDIVGIERERRTACAKTCVTRKAMRVGIDPRLASERAPAANAAIVRWSETERVQQPEFEARYEFCRIAASVDRRDRACQELVDFRHRKIRFAKRIDEFGEEMSGCKRSGFDDAVPVCRA